jgi:hypothetical protein
MAFNVGVYYQTSRLGFLTAELILVLDFSVHFYIQTSF